MIFESHYLIENPEDDKDIDEFNRFIIADNNHRKICRIAVCCCSIVIAINIAFWIFCVIK